MSSASHPGFGAQPHKFVYVTDMSPGLRLSRYMAYKPSTHPHILQNGTAAAPVKVNTLPTAVQGNVNTIVVPEAFGNTYIEMFQTTAQTLMPTIITDPAKGLEVALDQVDNESVEYVPGGNRAANPFACVVGTDPGVFIDVILEISNADGLDQMLIGFRKVETFAVPTSFLTTGDGVYTDFAGIGFAGTVAAANPVRTATDLNDSGSTTVFNTAFTVADTVPVRLGVEVRGGAVKYFINGVKLGGDSIAKNGIGGTITAQNPLTPPAFTFDAGDTIVPFMFFRQDALTSVVYISNRHATRAGLVVGQLLEDGRAPDQRDVGGRSI